MILDGDNSELTAIQFEYYAALSPFGDIPTGKVRIYLNDGESHATAEVPVDPRGEMELQLGGLVVYDNPRGVKDDIQLASGRIGDEFHTQRQPEDYQPDSVRVFRCVESV